MLVHSRGCGQRAAPGGGAAATTLQKRTLWKSVISAVSWPSGPDSGEKKEGQQRTVPGPSTQTRDTPVEPCPHHD